MTEIVQTQVNETARIEAFSDGVFAIAITLLVLELKVPEAPEGGLGRALLEDWPMYLAFLTSFATIGIMWLNHHRLFMMIGRSTHSLIMLNMLLLLGVTVVPFPTALIARNLDMPLNERIVALVYNGWFVLIAIAFNLLWRYASGGRRLLDPSVSDAEVEAQNRQYMFGPLIYLVAWVIAFVNPVVSIAMNLALALFFAFPLRVNR